MTPEEIFEEAERDDDGRVVYIDFSWAWHGYKGNTQLTNTVLGHIVIDGHLLTAQVNSAARAKTLRRKIDARLGGGIGRFKVDEIQDIDAVMSSHEGADRPRMNNKEQDELMQLPEVQKHLMEMIGKHWEGWVDQKIPVLDGKTPRKSVKTADGREAVEAILQDAALSVFSDIFPPVKFVSSVVSG